MSDKTYTNAQFGALIAKNTQWTEANAKWVKERLIENSRLLPDHGKKWSQTRISNYLFSGFRKAREHRLERLAKVGSGVMPGPAFCYNKN